MIRHELTGTVLSVDKVSPENLLRHIVIIQADEDLPAVGIKAGDTIEMQGVISPVIIRPGAKLRITGIFPGGAQRANIVKAAIVPAMAGAVQYLATGAIADINRTTAEKIVSHLGADAIDLLNTSPEKILEVPGISNHTSAHIKENWAQHSKIAGSVIEAMSVGLSAVTARRVVDTFGNSSADQLSANPYLLSYVQGYGFVRADNFAAMHGITRNNPIRIQAAMWHCLNMATYEGHTYLPSRELKERTAAMTKIDIHLINEVPLPDVLMATASDKIYIRDIYEIERYVASKIRMLSYELPRWNLSQDYINQTLYDNKELTPEQGQALHSILTGSRINVITGLPGTGKTTLIKSIVRALESAGLTCTLAAPTGKAANRITEQTGRPASTIHRLLGISRNGTSAYNQNNKIQTHCLVVDESSMLDIVITQRILAALPDGAALILVGDKNQLPALGPGNILKEIKERNLCNIVSLSQIHRQASQSKIIRLSHAIHVGVMPFDVFCGRECEFINEDDPEKIKDRIIEKVTNNAEYSPEQVQVLTPMKKGVIGTNQINTAIKSKIKGRPVFLSPNLNPMFDVGDRVIQKTNNYKKSVFNGEIGYVVRCDAPSREGAGKITVLFDDLKEVDYADHESYQLDYAWALTVHKAQGAQYPCIVMPLHTSHYIMLYRSLIYTAVTRAEKTVILIGSIKAAVCAVKNNRQDARYANLSEIDT